MAPFLKTMPLICMMAIGMIASAEDVPADMWGQRPSPELSKKVHQAVETSRTDPTNAESLLRSVLVADPNYYRAQLNLGLLLLQQPGRAKEAVGELSKALDIQPGQHIKDPTIYSELAFAEYHADQEAAATKTFQQGVEHLGELDSADQKKLLERGVAFFLDYQNPAGARNLFEQARGQLKPDVIPELQKFLDHGIERLTKNDVQDGWVLFAKQPAGASPDAPYINPLFVKIGGSADPIKKGDTVTPLNATVNMRADRLHPENKDSTLATWIGWARVGEQFKIDDLVPVQSADTTCIWIHIKRVKS